MFKNLFSFKDFDGHYDIRLFGIKMSFRHKCNFKYKPAYEYGLTREKRNPQIIVSMTSFPTRIGTTHLALNTILRQTMKPDRVILWLAEEQFPNKDNDLPQELLRLKEFGLEIKWCEDIKSYKKLVPALREFPDDIIVTTDDDIYYEDDWLESLYNAYKNHPDCVYCQRPRRLELVEDKINVISSRKSESLDLSEPDYFNQPLGGTGCLYPPKSLYKDVFDKEKFTKLQPTNDDIYFWTMAVLNRTRIGVAKGWKGNINQMDLRESGLGRQNGYLTDVAHVDPFAIMTVEYPELLSILKEGKND